MTVVVWTVFGTTFGATVLYAALGLTRPLDRTYLSFAFIMLMLDVYVLLELSLYAAKTVDEAVEVTRCVVVAAHGLLFFVLLFVPYYTRVRIPRWVRVSFGSALAGLFVTNLVMPYGLWYSAVPELRTLTFGGEPYTAVVAPPMSVLQYAYMGYVLSVFALTLICAFRLVRRERRRGVILASSLVIALMHYLVDIIRDQLGATWPYVAEFGLVTWGLIMSVQLAVDYRVSEQRLRATLAAAEHHANELARMVDETIRVRDKLNTPLQTLELSLGAAPLTSDDDETLAALRGAVRRITELGRAIELTTAGYGSANPVRGA
jgi:hypothetical protein